MGDMSPILFDPLTRTFVCSRSVVAGRFAPRRAQRRKKQLHAMSSLSPILTRRRALVCLSSLVLLGSAHAQSFFSLGVPTGGEIYPWSAASISNDGSVVTLVAGDDESRHVYGASRGAYWQNGVLTMLESGDRYVSFTQPIVTRDGQYLVYQRQQTDLSGSVLVLQHLATGTRTDTTLNSGLSFERSFGVSANGSIVVGNVRGGYPYNSPGGAWWTPADGATVSNWSLSNLDTFTGVSGDGQHIVGRFTHPVIGTAAVRISNGSFDYLLLSPEDSINRVGKISDDGSVFFGNGSHLGAFVWSDTANDVLRPTLPPTFTFAWAQDMTADGRYVVGSLSNASGSTGMIWDTQIGSVSTLADYLGYAPAGWTITSIDAISANGLYLAGTGIFDGQQLAWAYTVSAIPEPSTYAAIAGIGALGLALWRRRTSTNKTNSQLS